MGNVVLNGTFKFHLLLGYFRHFDDVCITKLMENNEKYALPTDFYLKEKF